MAYSIKSKNLAKINPALCAYIVSNKKFLIPAHIRLLADKLVDVANGKIKRLMINMPPRHGKSELISKYFPFWFLGKHPDKLVMLSSYETEFAASWGKKAKDLVTIHGKSLFDIEIEKGSNTKYKWLINKHNGGLESVGVNAGLTGKGADILIIDDPVKNNEQALSTTYRNKAWDWYVSSALTRLEPNGSIIFVMTRWHYDDLAGRILERDEEKWEVIDLPAIAENNDILGREVGEALWNKRFDINKLLSRKKTLGSYWFSCLYQQKPIASEYQIFKPSWWQFYKEKQSFSIIIQTWDTAFKQGQENDFTVCATWGLSGNNFYLIDLLRGKFLFPELKKLVVSQSTIHNPKIILIEDAASGQSLIQELRKSTLLPIKALKPISKEIRAHTISPLLENSQVFLPEGKIWLADFINEHSNFPSDKHDDIVDTTTMSLEYLNKFIKRSTSSNANRSQRERNNRFSNF